MNREGNSKLLAQIRLGSWLDSMANISELLINVVNAEQAKCADKLEPKW